MGTEVSRAPITRVFAGYALEVGEVLVLPEGEAHHVSKVLRGRAGDVFEVVDSSGRLFIAELSNGDEAAVTGEVARPDNNVGIEVYLYQAVPKGRHMDLVVEKATELGVRKVAPLVTDRGVVKLADGKAGRWRRVAEAAARQSLQLRVPEVLDPVTFSEAVREARGSSILLHNAGDLKQIEECVEDRVVSLFVGPEGGWSEDEIRLAEEAGIRMAQLGPYRLRSETAGIVAVARAWAASEGLSRGRRL